RTETTTAVTRKPAATPSVTTIPSVSNPGPEAKTTQPPTSSVEPLTVEEVERIIKTFEDNAPKHSPGRAPGRASAPTSVAKNASPPITIKSSSQPVENAAVGSQATNRLTNVLANAGISSPAKPQQKVASNASPAPPQLEANNVQPPIQAPRPSIEVRAPEVRVPDARARESGTKANPAPA